MLIKGNTHSFSVDIAYHLKSIEKALLLQHFYYWYQRRKYSNEWKRDDKDGWTYGTYKEFSNIFKYMKPRSIRYYLKALIKENYLITGKYSYGHLNGTTWYTLSTKGLELFEDVPDKSVNAINDIQRCIDKSVNAPDKSVNAPDKSVNAPVLKHTKSVNANNILSNSDITNTIPDPFGLGENETEVGHEEYGKNETPFIDPPKILTKEEIRLQKKLEREMIRLEKYDKELALANKEDKWLPFKKFVENEFSILYTAHKDIDAARKGMKEYMNIYKDKTSEEILSSIEAIKKHYPNYIKDPYAFGPYKYLKNALWECKHEKTVSNNKNTSSSSYTDNATTESLFPNGIQKKSERGDKL